MQLAGNTFLVTGAASGLGWACAQTLLRADARVILADLVAPSVEYDEARASFVRTDVTSESERHNCARASIQPAYRNKIKTKKVLFTLV